MQRNGDQPADRTAETHVALRDAAAGAIAMAHRLRGEGYLNVRITDTTTDEPCEEADLERAAQTEGG